MVKKLQYVTPVLVVDLFDGADLITESPSNYDGVGFIPGTWDNGWHA